MKSFSRRKFLQHCAAGMAAVTTQAGAWTPSSYSANTLGQVKLGKSGVQVSRLAMGTGTSGWNHQSNQTRLGMSAFVNMAASAYDAGITFFDVADTYGSHTFLRTALKEIPRERVVILTKIWTEGDDWSKPFASANVLDRFRKELDTDYLDIVLLHCQTSSNWLAHTQRLRDALSEAKAKGLIRAHGVSCHGFEALQAAAASAWVEVLLARINPFGAAMDAAPQQVMPVLKQAHERGAGVIGMKIFGAGSHVTERQRQSSLEYVWNSGLVDAMTIGVEKSEHITDAVRRTNRILRG
ncbi:aldo/keto reductase [candidate division KSB1 bacterium]|nr:aldo/keto reductase [candidate division KSB1 bacterium]